MQIFFHHYLLYENIEFKIQGSEVSADKKIIEDIKIPIMHILRNSIDHGIETPEERQKMGKSETGMICVLAEHREDKIIITIKDDGRGLDVQKIKAKAIEKGILTPVEAEKLPQEQLVNLVYYPGFSTEATIPFTNSKRFLSASTTCFLSFKSISACA